MRMERVVYIDVLRIIAVFGVIIIHVSAVGLSDYPVASATWNASLICGSLMRWSVPIFFMISGAMFLGRDKEYTFDIMIKRYIPQILLCILVWGIFYSLLDQFIYGTLSMKSIVIALWGVVSNHTGYHLWFLYTLVMLYLMIPVLRIIIKQLTDKQIKLMLVIWFFFSLGINQINELLSELEIGLSTIDVSLPVISEYVGYLVLGYYLYRTEISKKYQNIFIILGIASIVMGTMMNVYCSVKNNNLIEGFTYTKGVSNCLSCIAVFLLSKRIKKLNSRKIDNLIHTIAENVLGIYLVHAFINSLLFRIVKIEIGREPVIFSILIFALIIFMSSYIATVILKKIPIIKKIM